jgi:hypothetical protein
MLFAVRVRGCALGEMIRNRRVRPPRKMQGALGWGTRRRSYRASSGNESRIFRCLKGG